ncbi:uncharacterized protein BO95DRAFT_450962 [Aspergillus brunneoviolaceus CBS 621.78]|uniref:Uncharacterized protein n=1 Tax=Aspergillus brunneoviolaceus CBS 621.78 TaxID=1450534 RepID=A0ACD1GHI7_9EURO|nr:hypothetical protein BO95DRAFT_450962 [Aspergillus brunneoviolaceus CBS 621.78]RAH48717.1 hypothetical protein BO95DRAFT_450962 [Aspergillus brunneoviolaceus CBS 621.78]
MANIPAAIEAADAAGRIPAGISLEYLAQSRDRPAKIAIIFVCALTTLVVIARCYARIFFLKRFGMDDSLAVFTLLLYITVVVLSMVLIDLGSGRHIEYIEYVLSLSQVKETEVLDFVMHILYTTALFICRLSGLAFYHRLAARHDKLSLAIKLASIFLVLAFLTQFFLLLFHCLPITGLWPYEWQAGASKFKCLSWGDVYSVNSGLSLVCDLIMLVLPSMLIYMLHVSRQRKFQLSLIMFPGVLVLAISCARIYLVAVGQWSSDGSWAYDPMLAVETSEIGSTLIALSIPALKSLFGSYFNHLKASSSGGATSSNKRSSRFHRGYGRTWEGHVELNSLGQAAAEAGSYHVDVQTGKGAIATPESTSLGGPRTGNDSSSEDLLSPQNAKHAGRAAGKGQVIIQETVTVIESGNANAGRSS